MPNQLENTLQSLVTGFAKDILSAVRGASFDDLAGLATPAASRSAAPAKAAPAASRTAPARRVRGAGKASAAPRRGGKGVRIRRSPEQLAGTIDRIVEVLKGKKAGLGSEELQKELGMSKKDLFGPLTTALEQNRLVKTGNRRGTKYFVR